MREGLFLIDQKNCFYMVCKQVIPGLMLALVMAASCAPQGGDRGEGTKVLAAESEATLDSCRMNETFFPSRWDAGDRWLWVMNFKDSLFLTGYRLSDMTAELEWGRMGDGPDDFISPGLVTNNAEGTVGIYSNTGNKIVVYGAADGSLTELARGRFPIWNERIGICQPYTRLARLNDSIYAGTYFMAHEIGTDLINIASGHLAGELPIGIKMTDESKMSEPFTYSIAAGGNRIAIAYKYMNRLEVFEPDETGCPVFAKYFGEPEDQSDLYEADRDDEMIRYYSDIALRGDRIYALFNGVAEGTLSESETRLEIFNATTLECLANLNLKGYFDRVAAGERGEVYLYTPEREDYVFVMKEVK